jgi:hypothetical protein
MARGAVTFKQQDVTRALRAAAAAGVEVQQVEIDKTGKIILVTGKRQEQTDEGRGANEWDSIQ